MNEKEKLEFGIEIFAGMKASCGSWDIEEGRIDALMETETDRLEDPDYFKSLDDEGKEKITGYCKSEKERLHKQALFVADIALKKLEEINYQ